MGIHARLQIQIYVGIRKKNTKHQGLFYTILHFSPRGAYLSVAVVHQGKQVAKASKCS